MKFLKTSPDSYLGLDISIIHVVKSRIYLVIHTH